MGWQHSVFVFLLLVVASEQAPQQKQKNVVEVYFVVDQVVVNRYIAQQTEGDADAKKQAATTELKADIDYVITEMNKLYESVQSKGLEIEIAKKQVDILDYTILEENQEVDPGLKALDAWLEKQKAYTEIGYDAAIYWTGYDIYKDGDSKTAGYAHVGQICTAGGSGIAEFDLTYLTVVVTAHELGHILGASHDSQVTGNVMVPSPNADEPNRWDFSTCSVEAWQAVQRTLSTNCLEKTSSTSQVPNTGITAPFANTQQVCKRNMQDLNSYMCTSKLYGENDDEVPFGDNVCRRIWCKNNVKNVCVGTFASDGMICDQSKRCFKGSCVESDDAESKATDATCLWGDKYSISFKVKSGTYTGDCEGFIQQEGKKICTDKGVRASCCKLCADLSSGVEGCEYGNTYAKCEDYTQDQICKKYGDICCKFCDGWVEKRSADNTSDIILSDADLVSPYQLTDEEDRAEPEEESLYGVDHAHVHVEMA